VSDIGISNNDWNWRLVAAANIAENQAVTIDGAGKAAPSGGTAVVGFCPQTIRLGERCPVIRGGTISGLTGFTAGAKLKVQGTGLLGTAGATATVAVVKSEDASTAVILTENLYGIT